MAAESTGQRWERLKRTGAGDGALEIPSIPTGVDSGYGPVRCALGADGELRLLVPVGEVEPGSGFTVPARLRLEFSWLVSRGVASLFMDLTNLETRLEPVFAELVEDILRRLGEGVRPRVAVSDAVGDFRTLLEVNAGPIPSTEAVLGLLGEMVVLKRLARLDPGAVRAWVGPFEQRHDFRRGTFAIEVKTSGRSDATRVQVHGAQQLAPPLGGKLVLVHVRLERTDEGRLFVHRAFEDLRELGVDEQLLTEALSQLGCEDPASEPWNCLHCELEGMQAYLVEGDFPRIVPEHLPNGLLPPGLTHVDYTLDLSHAADWELKASDLDAVLSREFG